MNIMPIQYFGLGDVIFLQTAVRNIAGDDQIVWPVEVQFMEGLFRAYPDILFLNKDIVPIDYNRKDDYIVNNLRMIPFRWADQILRLPYTACMSSKYTMVGQDWKTWKDKAMWERDSIQENSLYEFIGLKEGDEYTLINRFWGSQSQFCADIKQPEGTVVEMCSLPGYSIFDWQKVIQNATHIHTASTSILYILEMLDLKAKEVHLYSRKPIEPHFDNVSYLFERHRYVLHV